MAAVTETNPLKEILVLHSDEALRRAVCTLVAEVASGVTICNSTSGITNFLKQGVFDLIVAGIGDGREALTTAREIRRLDPHTPLILVGDAVNTTDLLEVFDLRVCDVFERPFHLSTFVERIHRELRLKSGVLPDEVTWKRVNDYLGWPSFEREAQRIHGAFLDLKTQYEHLQSQSAAREEATQRIQSEEAIIMVERQDLENLGARLKATGEVLAKEKSTLKKTATELETERVTLKKARANLPADLEADAKALKTDQAMLEAQLADFARRREEAEDQIDARLNAITARESELESMAAMLDERENYCLGIEEKMADLKEREKELEAQIEAQTDSSPSLSR